LHPNSVTIDCAGAALELLPERAAYWQNEQTVFVADVHLGKEHAFANQGIGIPLGPSASTLQRLATVLNRTNAQRCIVLGDLFHDTPNPHDSWLAALSGFLQDFPHVNFSVVVGNHDKAPGQTMIDSRIHWHAHVVHIPPFVLQHEPGSHAAGYVLAGHIHPVAVVSQRFKRGIRGPCFWQQNHCMVLPAFGEFTGGYKVAPSQNDLIYMTGDHFVMAIPQTALSQKKRRRHVS